jgi:hypothetical protein
MGGIHIQTQKLMEGFIKYAAEMGSGAMIYVSSFMTTASAIPKLIGGTHTDKLNFI